jgi:murein DD-endopeptidase MepM/ murein hydrolase activator NlpD
MRRPRSTAVAAPAITAVVTVLAVAALLAVAPAAGAQAPPRPVTYRPPLAAPVVDPFRPPATPFGPGNRGLEYATAPGTPVVAAAEGIVTFAGTVAGRLHVTVQHADRLRTTYAFLAAVIVAEGATVRAGQVVGTTGSRFLWTARLGDAYLDPAVLLGASGRASVRLVPNRRDLVTGVGGDPRPPPVTARAAGWALGAGP